MSCVTIELQEIEQETDNRQNYRPLDQMRPEVLTKVEEEFSDVMSDADFEIFRHKLATIPQKEKR